MGCERIRQAAQQRPVFPFAVGRQTVIFPGFDGGGEWNGPAVDPVSGTLFVGSTEMAWLGGLDPVTSDGSPGEQVYRQQCAICHGANRAGSPPTFPSLVDVELRLGTQKVTANIHNGTGRMPSFPNLDDSQIAALLNYLRAPVASATSEMSAPPAAGLGPADKAGALVYADRCAVCHGDHMEGIPPDIPMLTGVGARMTETQMRALIHDGKERMPPMTDIPDADVASLLRFLGIGALAAPAATSAPEYTFTGYRKFLDPDGYPAIAPPWGTLNAIDLKSGQVSLEDSSRRIPRTGGYRHQKHRLRDVRRSYRYRRRRALHRRYSLRPQIPSLRHSQRQSALGDCSAVCRNRYPIHLHGRRQAICRHRSKRRPRSERPGRWPVCGLCAAALKLTQLIS